MNRALPLRCRGRRSRAAGPALRLAALATFSSVVLAGPVQSEQAPIPAGMLALYARGADTCPGLRWEVLAAIGRVESDHGRDSATSSAGAVGPMQFLPSTWEIFGRDGNGDGVRDVRDPSDAVYGAAAMLCAMGGADPARVRAAVASYNPRARWYSGRVMEVAAEYGWEPGGMSSERALAGGRVSLSGVAAYDVRSGTADPLLVELLQAAGRRYTLEVSVIETGHADLVRGTARVSLHASGRAADITAVDGQAVGRRNAAAKALVVWLAGQQPPFRPVEIGSPFDELRGSGLFSDADHQDHIHVGMSSAPAGTARFTAAVEAPAVTATVFQPADAPAACDSPQCGSQGLPQAGGLTCGPSSCSGIAAGQPVSWTCTLSACSGTFGNRTASWMCGGVSCAGTLGTQPVWWVCRDGSCSGALMGRLISWSCTESGCWGDVPFELSVVQSRSQGHSWPGLAIH